MPSIKLHRTSGVKVDHVQIGGGAPVVVQSMTITDTADAIATATQCVELSEAGSELVRVTVNTPAAAAAVPEIKQRMQDVGCDTPLIGDFHYNGHQLLSRYPGCAAALAKYRINPGNVGTGSRRDEQFTTICKIARDHGKPVRIGLYESHQTAVRMLLEYPPPDTGPGTQPYKYESESSHPITSAAKRVRRPVVGSVQMKSRRAGISLGIIGGFTSPSAETVTDSVPGNSEAMRAATALSLLT